MKKGKKKEELAATKPTTANVVSGTNANSQQKYLPYLLIFLFTCLVYGNTLWNKYASDDAIVLTENIYVKEGFSGIKDIFTHDVFEGFFKEKKSLVAGGRYRPLSVATFAVEYGLFGLDPMLSHAINVLLFGATCLLIYFLLLQLFPDKKDIPFYLSIPFLATLFYAAHPIHTEAVANIKGRDEIMSMLFAIASLIGTVLYISKGSKWLVFAGVSMFLSLLAKENSVTFLAVVPLTFYFFTKANAKQYLIAVAAILLPTVLYLILRSQYAASGLAEESSEILNNPFVHATFAERYATPVYSFLLYYYKLVFPHPLSHDYYFNQIPLIGFGDVKFITSAVVTIALLGISLNQLKRKTVVSYSILYYFITFSVVSNILFSVGIIMNERFLFMPSLGFCLLLAAGFQYFLQTKKIPVVATQILMVAVIGLYSFKTYSRNMVWKDNLTLFITDAKNSPNSAKVNTSAGGDLLAASDTETDSLKRKQMIEEAMGYLTQALKIYPENFNTLLLMGNAQFKYYKSAEAATPFYDKIIAMNKGGEFLANQNAGNLLFGEQKYALAIPYLKRAVNMQPDNIDMLLRLSDSYAYNNQADTALMYAEVADKKQPDNAATVHQLGRIYGKSFNRLDDAIPYLLKATQLNPNESAYLEDLGVAYGLKGDFDAVIETMNKLLQIRPNYKPAYMNLSISYRNKGDNANADLYMQKANE